VNRRIRDYLHSISALGTVILAGTVVLGLTVGCDRPRSRAESAAYVPVKRGERGKLPPDAESRIRAFCGDCHAFPQPDTFPRSAWPAEIERGFGLYFESRRTDLAMPTILEVVNFYNERAPENLDIPDPGPTDTAAAGRFTIVDGPKGDAVLLPATSQVQFRKASPGRPAAIISCDMRSGEVWSYSLAGDGFPAAVNARGELLARLANPAHAESCDLDGDGHDDLVVADLGSLDPADHDDGRVVWLRWNPADRKHELKTLVEKLGRVADVRTADFDGDGDQDLVVAEFGWHQTGKVAVLWNQGISEGQPRFEIETLHAYPGAIHVPTCDLDGDGLLDFVALVSQHQETVFAFLNRGSGKFEKQKLWSADDPSFGSSGLELVDLDGDGDLDVLGTCGDTFDNKHVKPYHGAYWLENQGGLKFQHRELARVPGAYRAVASDIDLDGDVDVVISGFLPHEPQTAIDMTRQHSMVLLEQVKRGEFRRLGLEAGRFDHATFTMGDFDEDGDPDLAVGEFPRDARGSHPRFRWWVNGTRKP
jgi:hypothetical protein